MDHAPHDLGGDETAFAPACWCMECRYDLRAHVDAERCPECGRAVAESRAYADRSVFAPDEAAAHWLLIAALDFLTFLSPCLFGHPLFMLMGVLGWLIYPWALGVRVADVSDSPSAITVLWTARLHRAVVLGLVIGGALGASIGGSYQSCGC